MHCIDLFGLFDNFFTVAGRKLVLGLSKLAKACIYWVFKFWDFAPVCESWGDFAKIFLILSPKMSPTFRPQPKRCRPSLRYFLLLIIALKRDQAQLCRQNKKSPAVKPGTFFPLRLWIAYSRPMITDNPAGRWRRVRLDPLVLSAPRARVPKSDIINYIHRAKLWSTFWASQFLQWNHLPTIISNDIIQRLYGRSSGKTTW